MKQDRFSEIQPNSGTREELLIVLEYLQNNAYDKKHATSQADILKYAEEKYHMNIRRDRIGQILIHLEQISKRNDLTLPFELKVVELNKIKRYYVGERSFAEDDVVKIISALERDKSLSPAESKRIATKLLDNFVSKPKQETVIEKSKKRYKGSKKINSNLFSIGEEFMAACYSQDTLAFTVVKANEVEISCEKKDNKIKAFLKSMETTRTIGFAYSYYELANTTVAVIYFDDIKQAIATPLYNLRIEEHHPRWNDKPISFALNNSNYTNIDSWLKDHFSGQDGEKHKFVLKITTNDRPGFHFLEFCEKYKKYWEQLPKFEYKDRVVELTNKTKDGEIIKEKVIAKDAYFSVEANMKSFLKWYDELGNFDNVVIVEPKELNDLVLSEKIARYCRRINKYGAFYNFSYSKERKPEFEEEIKQREEHTRPLEN